MVRFFLEIMFKISSLIGFLCLLFSFGPLAYFVKTKVFKKNEIVDIKKYAYITKLYSKRKVLFVILGGVVIVFTIFSFAWFRQLIGFNDIEYKPSGTYCYYVEIESENGKKYVLPAKINIDSFRDEVAEGQYESYRYYYLEKVYFSNGEYLYFDDSDSDIYIDEVRGLFDQNYNNWIIKLLNKSAYCSDFEETSAFSSVLNVSLEIMALISEIFVYTWCIVYKENEKI